MSGVWGECGPEKEKERVCMWLNDYCPAAKGMYSLILVIPSSIYPTNIYSAPTIYAKEV